MISPKAIQHFTERQRQLVHDSYDQAWQQGVTGYTPNADPEDPTPVHQHAGEESTLSGAMLLAARAQRAYTPPDAPDMARRQQALAGALASTDKMASELATLSPDPEQMEAAQQEADAGKIPLELVAATALGYAVAQWAESNSSRLDQGASVAWAGEQAGYAEAADQNGKLLNWADTGDDVECGDCEELAAMGPMPLEDFPTTPGDGATECNAGCRCSLEAVPVEWLEYGSAQEAVPALSEGDSATLERIAGQARERMDKLAPAFA